MQPSRWCLSPSVQAERKRYKDWEILWPKKNRSGQEALNCSICNRIDEAILTGLFLWLEKNQGVVSGGPEANIFFLFFVTLVPLFLKLWVTNSLLFIEYVWGMNNQLLNRCYLPPQYTIVFLEYRGRLRFISPPGLSFRKMDTQTDSVSGPNVV